MQEFDPPMREDYHMEKTHARVRARSSPGAACPGCGHAAVNGAVGPTPSPEMTGGWVIERPSSDVLAWARQTFNEAEFRAALREVEQGGSHHFEDFIDEIERIAHGKE